MARSAKLNFVQQQGFKEQPEPGCELRYRALMFQPRIVGVLVVVGLILQSGLYFLALSLVLWWGVLFPGLNPFDAAYNSLIAEPKALPPLTPAPAPRRFAQGMAAGFMLLIGLFILLQWQLAAWIFEGFLIAALSALIFGKFCLGSYLFFLFKGEKAFADRTLPWTRT